MASAGGFIRQEDHFVWRVAVIFPKVQPVALPPAVDEGYSAATSAGRKPVELGNQNHHRPTRLGAMPGHDGRLQPTGSSFFDPVALASF
jgi:hypothetical protein